jgi:hypothetical protein
MKRPGPGRSAAFWRRGPRAGRAGPGEALADRAVVAGQDLGEDLARIEGELGGGDEQLLLGAEVDGPRILALARRDPESQTVSLTLDATTANIAMFAIAAHADEREAHVREVQQFGHNLPEGSYGRHNRDAIAARETRVATRLRAVEQAYRLAIERDAAPGPTQPATALRSAGKMANHEIEME